MEKWNRKFVSGGQGGRLGSVFGYSIACAAYWRSAGTLLPLAAQQMTTCHEQIGQRTGYEQAMSILLEPAITHLGEAEQPRDDPDRMFDRGPRFGLGTIFRPLGLIDNAAVAVAAIDKVLRSRCVSADHGPLAAIRPGARTA